MLRAKNYIFTITFLIFGSFLSIPLNFFLGNYLSNDTDSEFMIPYVDNGCTLSKSQFQQQINSIEDKINSKINIKFYEHPSRLFCQGRPVISNSNFKLVAEEENVNINIGIGVNTDLENFERMSRFCLLFFLVLGFFNKFKFNEIQFQKLKINDIIIFSVILLIYGIFPFTSLINSMSNIFISLIMGNIIIYTISKSYSHQLVFKSFLSLMIFPMFFNDSNITFSWMFLLYSINLFRKNKLKIIYKFSIFLFFTITFSFFANYQNLIFKKPTAYFDWVLFRDGRHKGGIVDILNGAQSIVYIIDIFVLIFVMYSLFFEYFKTSKKHLERDFQDSLIIGFYLWILGYYLSTIGPSINLFIFKLFGLNEEIDSILTVHPDGTNWRGLTSSHELTGFWLLLIICIATYRYLNTKSLFYIFTLSIGLVSLSWNSQRTALILFVIFLIALLLKFKSLSKYFLLIIIISNLVLLINNDAMQRLQNRIDVFSLDFEISENYQKRMKNSEKRFEEYNIQIPKPSKKFNEFQSLKEFYEYELGTKNKILINSITTSSKIFGRDIQWIKFFHYTDLNLKNIITGYGAGQSHQHLVVLVEKPHSLYLSVIYQFGILGIVLLFYLLITTLNNFVKSQFNLNYLLGIYFFIVGLKAEFIFTHNQILLFITFMIYLHFLSKTSTQSFK